MEIRFCISGSTIFSTNSNIVPAIGSEVTICTDNYKKGMWPGTILNFKVSQESPPQFDYTCDVCYIDVNGYTVVREGQNPEEQ